MCTEPATSVGIRTAMPHPAPGDAPDPIALEPADDVVITTLAGNVYDALLTGDDTITRAPFAAGTAQAPQFEPGCTSVGLMAEHGFSALVTVRRADTATLSPPRYPTAGSKAAAAPATTSPLPYPGRPGISRRQKPRRRPGPTAGLLSERACRSAREP